MFDQIISQLVLVAVFVERGVQFIKAMAKYDTWADEYQAYIDQGLTVCGSAGLCYAWSLDIFAVAGIGFGAFPWIGNILTGVVVGLGGNVLHELIELLKMWRDGPASPDVMFVYDGNILHVERNQCPDPEMPAANSG